MKNINLFEKHTDYEEYINSEDVILPNLSYCIDADDVHFNPWTDPKLVCKYNITDISSPTALRTEYEPNMFKSMEIDGVVLDSLVTEYQFSTTGEHTVKYELYDKTKVGNNAPLFDNITTLSSVFIPNSVTTIGKYAFNGCTGITSLTIGNSVTTIGDYAFKNCSGLTSVIIPNSVTSINYEAFNGCTGITSLTIGNSVTTIGDYAFNNCTGITNVIIPNSVTSIGADAFYDCKGLTSVTIGNSVTTIDSVAFFGCTGLTTITSLATTAPTINSNTFQIIKSGGTLYIPTGSTGYDVWMGTGDYYLGKYSWTKVEQ